MKPIDGIVSVLPVPFFEDETIDEASLRRLVDFCVEWRAEAICLPAYGGEFYKLTEEERVQVVRVAAEHAAGRVPVIGQANHHSSRIAADLARRMQDAGADMINVATPRLFALTEEDLIRFCATVANAVDRPLMVQDFNPGGVTVGADFVEILHRRCPSFTYIKLEEPMMGDKVRAILDATKGEVGVLEGWGGMYLMELIPVGICGAMPGCSALPILQHVYRLRKNGNTDAAYETFKSLLPFIVFQLQNLELFLLLEKRFCHRLGLLTSPRVRDATLTMDAASEAYGDFLIEQVIASFPERPSA